MTPRRNPFLVALVVVGVVSALLSFVLASIAGGPSTELLLAAGASAWAGILLQVAIFAILGALVAAAITWRPSPRPEEAVAERPTPRRADVDTTGMTPGEQRFFSES